MRASRCLIGLTSNLALCRVVSFDCKTGASVIMCSSTSYEKIAAVFPFLFFFSPSPFKELQLAQAMLFW